MLSPCPDLPRPVPENAKAVSEFRITNLVREPLSKPVKEEGGRASARDFDFDSFFAELPSRRWAYANASLPGLVAGLAQQVRYAAGLDGARAV